MTFPPRTRLSPILFRRHGKVCCGVRSQLAAVFWLSSSLCCSLKQHGCVLSWSQNLLTPKSTSTPARCIRNEIWPRMDSDYRDCDSAGCRLGASRWNEDSRRAFGGNSRRGRSQLSCRHPGTQLGSRVLDAGPQPRRSTGRLRSRNRRFGRQPPHLLFPAELRDLAGARGIWARDPARQDELVERGRIPRRCPRSFTGPGWKCLESRVAETESCKCAAAGTSRELLALESYRPALRRLGNRKCRHAASADHLDECGRAA